MEDEWPLTTSLSSATAEASAASPSLTERFHWSCTKLDSGAPSMHSEDASQLRYAARSFKLHAAMDELVRESLAHIDTRVFALKEHLYQKLAKRDKSCTGGKVAAKKEAVGGRRKTRFLTRGQRNDRHDDQEKQTQAGPLTETWLHDTNATLLYLPDYHSLHATCPCQQDGGVFLCVRCQVDLKTRPDLDVFTQDIESIFAEVQLPSQGAIIIGAVYRPRTRISMHSWIISGDFQKPISLKPVSELEVSNCMAKLKGSSAPGKDLNTMTNTFNNELIHLNQWFTANRLSLNISKTHAMMCSMNRQISSHTLDLRIHNTPIDTTIQSKFLGIHIDISKSMGILTKVPKYPNKATLHMLYNSFALPYLHYGNIMWRKAASVHVPNLLIVRRIFGGNGGRPGDDAWIDCGVSWRSSIAASNPGSVSSSQLLDMASPQRTTWVPFVLFTLPQRSTHTTFEPLPTPQQEFQTVAPLNVRKQTPFTELFNSDTSREDDIINAHS
ncbi:hypothetical protein CAPTEDRAFT_205558 [Capitella teleta]|uniref:Reverse transcriptase domain-containing protein n=1 Tax=Capitella teleta TaxID=283909 RepID=R7TXV8_CAPTE|nr:hypothetical protein CAPTEDRAFT_205558 [Capitella teleta]|eukprot:ELT98447.1 hypothetical protein CAPTEDRAFT_205558 [Capitella teleta]